MENAENQKSEFIFDYMVKMYSNKPRITFFFFFFFSGGVAMVLQHKYFIRKHYVQVPYAVNANMDLICLSYSLQFRWTFETHHS